jgi:hypothetical protein
MSRKVNISYNDYDDDDDDNDDDYYISKSKQKSAAANNKGNNKVTNSNNAKINNVVNRAVNSNSKVIPSNNKLLSTAIPTSSSTKTVPATVSVLANQTSIHVDVNAVTSSISDITVNSNKMQYDNQVMKIFVLFINFLYLYGVVF